MANKPMKRWSTSLLCRGMQIKTTVNNYSIPIWMAIKCKIANVGEYMDKLESFFIHC